MKKRLALVIALALLPMLLVSFAHAETDPVVPELTIARRPIPENEAMDFLKKLGFGWNLGNTFDAEKGDWNRKADEMTVETSWGNPKTSEAMIDALCQAGFTTIRVPVSWHDHVSGADYEISERWLARVQEVVNWAYDRGMHVILNIHHDESQFQPSSAHYEESAHYIACVWKQLADRFRDYDERLIMESMNEPRLLGSRYEWSFDPNAADCQDAADCLNRLNQLFVDTVRAAGGQNADRYLMVPAYCAAPENAVRDSFVLPADSAENKIIVSVHAYTPYAFALQMPGTSEFKLGYASDTQPIVVFMNNLYSKYIVNGIPVVIGEFGAMIKNGNHQARTDWTAFYAATASARNLPVLWWDNGLFSGNGERFGLLDRKTCAFPHQTILDALVQYGGWEKLPDPQ